jgi:hypothetical protein
MSRLREQRRVPRVRRDLAAHRSHRPVHLAATPSFLSHEQTVCHSTNEKLNYRNGWR